jgi:hypothetical protein
MNFKTTVLLLAVLVIVFAAWLFVGKGRTAATEESEAPVKTDSQKYVFDPQPKDAQLVRVALQRPDAPGMVFERVDTNGDMKLPGEWRMTEPLTVPADGNRVLALARTVANLMARPAAPAGSKSAVTPADAGLAPPAATVALTDQAGKQYELEIGSKAPMSSDTYVRVAGQQAVQLTMRDLQPQYDKEVKDFRVKTLVRFKPDEAVRVRVEHEGKTYEFSRGADGDWVIDSPLRTHADKAKIREKILTPLSTLQATEFVDDAPESLATYGLDEPYLAVTLTTEKTVPKPAESQPASQPAEGTPPPTETVTETQRLLIGGFADLKSEKRYAKTDAGPSVATVTGSALANLLPKLNELRDVRVLRIKPADVTQLEVVAGGSAAVLKKVNNAWQGTDDLAQLEPEAVNDVVDALANLSAISFIDEPQAPAEYGLDKPRVTLTATVAGSVTPLTLRIGGETASGRNAYAQREGEPGVVVISEAQANRLVLNPLMLRSREVFTFPPDRLQQVQLERGRARYSLVRDGAQWKLTEPADAPVDASAVNNLANDLSRLRAKRVVAKGDDPGFGLDHPAVTVRFDVAEPPPGTQPTTAPATQPVSHTLVVGFKDKAAYARKDDDPYVFELDETVYKVLTAELIDPRLFSFKPEDVTGIKIAATGGTLELVRDGKTWKYAPDPYVELAQKKVEDFIKDVAQMRAETFVQYRDGDLAAAGLTDAPASVTIRLANGTEQVIHMAQGHVGELPTHAALLPEKRVFVLKNADCEKLLRGLDEYVKSEKPEKPETPRPGVAGLPPRPGQPPLPNEE